MEDLTKLFDGILTSRSRLAILVASLLILPAIFLPAWRISLQAPQYPDGLTLEIYPTTVAGELDEVNILNHYIGMREISPDDFEEFRFIPFFILRFVAFGALAALVGRMSIAALGWIDFVIFGGMMLYTLQHFLYEYGNNLDPRAPIDLEPFTPSLLGGTMVGQFQVTSMPGWGAILMFVAGFLGPLVVLMEMRHAAKTEPEAEAS